jgi:hypothetical protein
VGYIIGLTGGIASGKSFVSEMLKELGAQIIDADLISRQVVEPGKPAWKKIVKEFGKGIINKAHRPPRLCQTLPWLRQPEFPALQDPLETYKSQSLKEGDPPYPIRPHQPPGALMPA